MISLFIQFMKYGLLCFGGGYMIIPLLYADLVQESKFFTPESYGNLLSVSQMTPGAVSVNTATYIGYLDGGIMGAFFATLGLCFPTFILASSALYFLGKYQKNALIIGLFKGIKWAALIMILSAVILFANISVIKISSFDNIEIHWLEVMIAGITILLSRKLPFTILLIGSAFLGWGISYIF